MSLKKVNSQELEKAVEYAAATGKTMYIEGFAGTGKSTTIHEAAKKLGMEVIDIRVSTLDIGDLVMRMPNADKTAMMELINQDLVRDKPTIYLFDEFLHGTKNIQKMCYQIFLDRKMGTYRLPKGSAIFALANPQDEVDSDGLDRPMWDRMDMKVYLEFDLKKWEKWAYEHDVRAEVISFVDMFADKVINTDVDGMPLTPRTWERVSRALDDNVYQQMLPSETGLMFKSYLDKITAFKDVDKYLDGKEKLDDKLDIQFAFSAAMTNKITKNPKDATVLKWYDGKVKGMREEVKVFGNVSVLNRHKQLVSKGETRKYFSEVDKEIQKQLMVVWKDLGYLMDDKM